MTTPREDAIAALPGHPSPDRGSGPWVLRLVCCGYDDGIERYATWDEADTFRQAYVTGPGGHDRAAILTRDLDTTYHRRRVARRLAASRAPSASTRRRPMPSGDFRPPSTDWQQGYDAGYREAQEDAEQAAVPLDVERLERAIADIEHPAALAARPDVGSGPFDHEPPDLGTHCAGCAARPVSPPLDVAARAYREAHDLLAVTHTSAQRTVVIERLNDLAKAALAAP